MMLFLRLMFEFAKTGLFAVGGGLATLPFLYEIAEKTGWYTQQDIMNLIAVSESTPGAIGVNMSTYVGFITGSQQLGNFFYGVLGGIAATLALAAPSIVVIVIISKVLDKFRESKAVKGVFKGLRPASTALIAVAGLGVAKLALLDLDAWTGFNWASISSTVNWVGIVLAAVIWFGLKKLKKHPIVYIGFAALVGIALGYAGMPL